MKRLLLSVAALVVATLLLSLGESNDVKEGVTQDNNNVEVVEGADNAS